LRIAGILSWFDESPAWLAAATTSLGRFCDIVIAHDGAYQLFPGARPRSHPQQAEAVMHAAEAMDMACVIYRPKDIYWGNEVEKRNEGFRIAGALLEPDEDWVVVWDADYHLLKITPERVRHDLEHTDCDVATYTLLDGKDMLATPALEQYAQQRPIDTEWTIMTRDIFRWHPTLAVGPLHWSVSVQRNGKREWLRGPFSDNTFEPLAPAHDLRADLVAYHRTQDRAHVRKHAAKGYYERRAERGIEDVNEAVEMMKADVGWVEA
jgi:hypothetical protein